MLLALRRYAVSDTKRLAWGFDPIEKSRVNHASFMDLAPRQYSSYLIEINSLLVPLDLLPTIRRINSSVRTVTSWKPSSLFTASTLQQSGPVIPRLLDFCLNSKIIIGAFWRKVMVVLQCKNCDILEALFTVHRQHATAVWTSDSSFA
ncbi:hypothetical protein LSAT2_028021 [Lamellibrachia satsuma]|nr:hypothetical protein LSAT2_028021 [Lamellibrachia satsuma]